MNVKNGDYYIFDLPKHFKIYNTINSPLYDSENHQIGNFTVTKDGKVTMTFNDYVEEHPDVAGNLQLKTEFNKAEIKGTTTQEIPFLLKIRMFLLQLTLSLMYKQLRIKRIT